MSTVTLAALKGVNETSIQRAGARYTPSIDSNAPNLELRPLVNAVAKRLPNLRLIDIR